MLLSKLAKAKNPAHNLSPSASRQPGSGSKRATLEIFSQFRQAEDLSEQGRATDDELEAMLNQNLLRENLESPRATSALFKQFQIASDVANNILDEDAEDADFLPSGAWTSPNISSSGRTSRHFESQATPGGVNTKSTTGSSHFDSFGGMPGKGAPDVYVSPPETSMFSLHSPAPADDHQPKLNAQTLFAFGVSFYNAYSIFSAFLYF